MSKHEKTMNAKVDETVTEQKPQEKEKGMEFFKLLSWSLRPASTGIAVMIMGYLSIFCTDTLEMNPALVGVLLLVSKVIDGITNLFAGYIVDRTNTRWGKGRPYEWCVVGMWLSTFLLYATPQSFSTPLKCIWILIMYSLANSIFYTFLCANTNVYMIRAFSRQKDYIDLSTYGGLVPMLLTLVFNIIFPILMGTLATSPHGWRTLVAIFAVPLTLLGMLRFFVIKEKNDIDVESHGEQVKLKDVFKALKSNPYIYIIAVSTFAMNLTLNMGVNVYYFTHIVGNVKLLSILAATQIVILPLMFVLPQILKKTTVAKVMKGGLIFAMAGFLVNFFAGKNVILLTVANLMIGGGLVPISMLANLLIIDCAEYNEYKGHRRLEGSLTSVNGFASLMGAGIGSGILGILIGIAGYNGRLSVQPDSAITMIRMLYSLIPFALFCIVFILFSFYKLDKLIPEIRKTNEERRKAIVEAVTAKE
ncbi:MAG: MFS transporter [Lachnotalea sp.]